MDSSQKTTVSSTQKRITVCPHGYVHVQVGQVTLHFTHDDFMAFMESGAEVYRSLLNQKEALQ